MPRSIVVALEDDLVDCCQAGDDVRISFVLSFGGYGRSTLTKRNSGTVYQRWKPPQPGARCDVEIVLRANYVHDRNESLRGRNATSEEMRRQFEAFWEPFQRRPLEGSRIPYARASEWPKTY